MPTEGRPKFCTECLDLSDAYLMWWSAIRDPRAFWTRNHHNGVIAAADLPPHPEPTEDQDQFVIDVLHEAVALRQGAIPFNAVVEVNYPPITAVQLCESMFHEVAANFFTAKGRTFELMVSLPREDQFDKLHPKGPFQSWIPIDDEEMERRDGSTWWARSYPLRAIAAAIIRDFLVIEDRTTVLGPPRYAKRVKSHIQTGPVVVYLPRIRYKVDRFSREAIDSAFSYAQRRAHFVRDHLRRLPDGRTPTKVQNLKAKVAGIEVPDGHTWVQAHERGGDPDRETVYRSRSVSQIMFEVLPHKAKKALQAMSWFDFENHVAQLAKAWGYTVIIKSPAGADGGIDVLAAKETSGREQTVIFQAKHWSKPVGVNIIRECAGIRQLHETDRIVLVTSSYFTAHATLEAKKLDVELIDGTMLAQYQ